MENNHDKPKTVSETVSEGQTVPFSAALSSSSSAGNKPSLKKSFPDSPEARPDNMSFDDHNEPQYSDGTPSEGVHPNVWEMLLSIKKILRVQLS